MSYLTLSTPPASHWQPATDWQRTLPARAVGGGSGQASTTRTPLSADLLALKQAGFVPHGALAAKVMLSGKLDKKVKLVGIAVTKGAKAAIEAAGGSVEAAPQA